MDVSGKLLPPGEFGEVVIRGRNVTAGYENNPDANAAGLHQWLVPHRRPGVARRAGLSAPDRAAQGAHQPRRREDQPDRGGYGADGPSGGRAVPDFRACRTPMLGEEVAAAVVLREGMSVPDHELRDFASARLAAFKVPRKIVFLHRDSEGRDRQAAAHRAGREARLVRMRIGVFGAGAIGGLLGAKLAAGRGGCHVHRARPASRGDAGERRPLHQRRRDDHRASALSRRCGRGGDAGLCRRDAEGAFAARRRAADRAA